jgi:hypothetical protein
MMKKLKDVIASHQRALRGHSLFAFIEETNSVEPIGRLARAAAWWPMVFQDVLRLNVDRVRGTGFERFAEFHKNEDAEHDRWYLNDLRVFGAEPPGLDELFNEDFQPVRDACYKLVAEVHREQSGAERIALLLALEPTGHVFFEQISAAVDRVCPDLPLRYFARSHLGVEKAHDLFTESTEADLGKIVLSDAERVRAEAMVGRIYGTFSGIFSYFADRMLTDANRRSEIRALSGGNAAAMREARHAGAG